MHSPAWAGEAMAETLMERVEGTDNRSTTVVRRKGRRRHPQVEDQLAWVAVDAMTEVRWAKEGTRESSTYPRSPCG